VSIDPGLAADAEKTADKHVLYLGLDVSLTIDDATSPVVDADHSAVHVARAGQRHRVPLRLGGTFQTNVVPRVGRSAIHIENLSDELTYSRQADPRKDAMAQEMILATAQSAEQEFAEAELYRTQADVDLALVAQAVAEAEAARRGWSSYHRGPSAEQLAAASTASRNYAAAISSNRYSSRNTAQALAGGDGDFNALAIQCTLSSPEPVRRPYAVMRVFLRKPEKPDEPLSSIRFFRLPDLGPKPRKVQLLHENLPAGFSLDRYELHVYSQGEELPTNLSPHRVELTLDEVHQFFVLKHISEHSSGDAPIAIVRELLDHDLRQHVSDDQLNRAVDVTVDAAGRVTNLELEPHTAQSPDAYISSVLQNVRFLPAVQKGKPIAGKGRFVLSEFLQ
jgi:hypothetical protein